MIKNLQRSLLTIASALFLISANAQTGPAGVGNAAGINGQPANEIWFDASSLGLTDGEKFSNWADISGNGNDGTQLNSTYQPTYHDETDVNYNYPVVSFDGTDDFIPFDGNVIAGKDYTIFVVGQRRSNGYMKSVLLGGFESGANLNLHFHLTGTELRSHHYSNELQTNFISNTEAYSSGTDIDEFGIFATRLSSTETDPYRKNYQNNYYLTEAHADNSKLISWNGSALARKGGSTYYYSEIEIAEVIIFSQALNAAQLEITNNYLSEKYNITIDNDIYSAQAGFKENIAGIGNRNFEKHSRAASSGFYINERDNTLADGEFIFFSHNAIENTEANINTDAHVTATTAVAAWGREWYVDAIASTTADIQLVFDFPEAFTNGKYPKNEANYRLLWRANTSSDYSEVTTIASGLADADQVYFNVDAAAFSDGYFTIGTTNQSESPLKGVSENTWYALHSGDWDVPDTWTLDPSGNLPNNPDSKIPSLNASDKVVIHSGKTVTVNVNNIANSSLDVQGRIDFVETTGHHFDIIKGSGRILMAANNFPTGTATDFYTKGLGEGTVIYQGSSFDLSTAHEFYNLEIELTNSTDILTLLSDYTINGNLEIKKGILKINNDVSTTILNLTVKGNLSISAESKMLTGTGKTIGSYSIPGTMPISDGKKYHSIYHQLELWGNFTNNGIASFTNLPAPIYNQFADNGVTVRFKGTNNNTALLNGQTDFYNLIIDKGTDQTYVLNIYSENAANFKLFGANNVGQSQALGFSSENPQVRKALFIQNGTLKLSGLINIPTLTEGYEVSGNGDYFVGANAQLWLAGNVNVYVTASDNSTSGNTQVDDASGATVNTLNSQQAFSLLGKFRITDGVFGTRNSAGFIFWTSADAQVYIEGGKIYVAQLRSAGGGGGTASYKQTAGKLYLEGSNNGGDYTGSFPIFGIDNSDGVFQMSGGEIIIQDQDGDSDPEFYIPSSDGNYLVTGGTVRFELPDATSAQLYSTANLWDLELENTTGSGNVIIELANKLKIANDLTINDFATLDVEDAATNIYDIEIGRNFTIEHDGIYLDKTATTTFNGNKNGLITFNNRYLVDGTDVEEFYRMVIEKPNDKILSLASGKTGAALDGNNNNVLDIVGTAFILKSGTFDYGNLSVRIYSDTLINYGIFGVYDEIDPVPNANSNGNNDLIKFRPEPFVLLTNSNSKFGNVRLNNADEIVILNSDVYMQRLEYKHGRLNMQSYNLKLDKLDINLNASEADYDGCGGCNSVEDMFIGSGLSSDKGLSLRITGNGTYVYPIGIGTTGIDTDPTPTSKYTPVEMTISNFIDSGYVTISPVNDTLSTTAHDGSDILIYYWSINHDSFDNIPTVEYLMKYYDADVVGTETNLVPGRVLSSDPYTRLSDQDKANVVEASNTIIFDVFSKTDNSPLSLENADYTAGKKITFDGEVTKFYAIVNGKWGDKTTWDANKVPTLGSIAIIPNGIRVNVESTNKPTFPNKPAEVRFEHDYVTYPIPTTENVPRLQFIDAGSYDIGIVTGTGLISFNTATNPTVIADFGAFGSNPHSFFMYEGADTILTNIPTPIPNLVLESNVMTIGEEITVSESLIIHNDATCIPTENITIGNDLLLGALLGGSFVFPATGNELTIDVEGNVDYTYLDNTGTRQIYVEDATSTLEHRLIVKGDIIHGADDAYLFQLYKGTDRPKVVLELQGVSNNTYNRTSTSVPSLYRIEMNKDTSQLYSFSFDNAFSLNGETDTQMKAIELNNGTLILNHASIDVNLNTGNYDFKIPAEAALQVNLGTVNILGDNTGLWLDGKLFINGGSALFNGAGNGNNYIEYSASGTAEIEIASGTLTVGSQIRRQLNTEEGVLSYTQTGGAVEIGTKYPKEGNRGVFEILSAGSSFNYTGGSFILAQSQQTPSIASFYFNPETVSLFAGSTIQFGSANTISARNNFGIYAASALQNVSIDNTSGVNPKLTIWTVPLSLNEDLIIGAGTEFDANGENLFIAEDLENNGTFNANSNLTIFNGSTDQEIKGTSETTFYQLTKPNSNTLTLQNNIYVTDEFRIEDGVFADSSYTANIQSNIYNAAIHTSGELGNGILLNGIIGEGIPQEMIGSGTYGKLSINNYQKGVKLATGSNILVTNMLKMENGVFNIGGNLLTIAKMATIFPEKPFSTSNMIQTNISFTDNGVKKFYPSGSGTFVYPIGSGGKYTPVKVIANSNPDENGFLIAKASNEPHPSVQEDTEAPENVEINDQENVLQYYWTLTSENFTDVSGNVEFYYNSQDTKATTGVYDISDYIPARLLENSTLWNKYDWADFDQVSEKIIFQFTNVGSSEISGDYTAGVQSDTALLKGAIPDQVAVYETITDGNWSDGTIWSPEVTGGPRGAVVLINSGHTVISDKNYMLAHRVEINGRLETENTFGNRLGLVSGTGTLSTESGLLPAGFYNKFFFAESGGTLEYTGTDDYDALNNLAEVNNVTFSGTGDKRLPNLELTLLGDLIIDGDDANLKVINEYNNKLTIKGNFTLGTGSFDAGNTANTETILELSGTAPQTISGDFTAANSFNYLTVNNPAGVNLTSTVELNNDLTLTNGIITVLGSNKLVMNNIGSVINDADCSKYISGILSKKLEDNASFIFPIGKNGNCGRIEVQNIDVAAAAEFWEAEYFNEPADNGGMSTDAFTNPPLTFVSKSEYWRVESAVNSSQAGVKLFWNDLSGISANEDDQDNTRIVKWTTGTPEWEGISGTTGVDHNNKTITSLNSTINYNEWANGDYFTFATMATLPTMIWTGASSELWEDEGNWDVLKVPYAAADVEIPDVSAGSNRYPRIYSAASCKALDIQAASNLWIMPSYTLRANGNTQIDGEFVLADSHIAVSQFIDNGTIEPANANVHVHHWLPANKYTYISSPLTLAERDVFNNRYGTNPNFYKYVETNVGTGSDWMDGWVFGDATLVQGRGYASGWPGRGTYIKFLGGTLNTGTVTINVTKSAGHIDSTGWNLIGNPYPSAVDAALFVTANSSVIDGALYFWDDDSSLGETYAPGDYATWNLAGSVSGQASLTGAGTNKIPDGFIGMAQGFFVRASTSGTVSFENNMRTFGNGQFFNTKKTKKEDNIQRIRLNMQNDKFYNEMLLTFTDLATDGFDNLYDARKMKTGNNLAFYSLLADKSYSIQSLSEIKSANEYKAIPIGFEIKENGVFNIQLNEIVNINENQYIYLDDREAESLTNLRKDSLYEFTAQAGENKTRFRIIFSNKPLSYEEIELDNEVHIYAWKESVIIKINSLEQNTGELTISNLGGQILENRTINNNYYFNIPMTVEAGIYLVRVESNGKLYTKKVYIE